MTQPYVPGMFGQTLAEVNQPQYGQFTGYTPIPGVPHGYDFDLASGGKRKLVGPPAQALAGQIDAARGAPTQANTFASTKGGGRIALREGGDPSNPADYIKEIPGSRGSAGGMMAQGMTSRGGYNVDEQFLDQMEGSQLRTAAIQQEGIERGVRAAAERQGFMDAQKAQAERELAVQAHENAVKQQRLGDFQAKYDKAEQDYTNFHAEKEREAESPKAKMATFIGALSSALGALGAGLARTPNFAAEAVARHNEMQLRREEAELRVRKDNRDTMLGQLQQQMGSLDLAKSAYRAMQAKQSAMGWEMLAQKEQDAGKQQQLMQVAELQNQQYLKWREEYVRGAEGEVTRTFRYQPPTSGAPARRESLTLEEHGQVKDLLQKDANLAKTRSDVANGPDMKEIAPARTETMNALAGAVRAARGIELNIAARKMGEDNTIDDPLEGGVDALHRAASSVVGGDRAKLDNQLKADTFALARGLQTNYGKSDNDARMADEAARGNGSAADRLRAARATKNMAVEKLRGELSTLPPDQQRRFLSSLDPKTQAAIKGQE